MRLVAVLAAVAVLPGCAQFSPLSASKSLKPGAYWMSYDTSRRGAWVRVSTDGEVTSCSEPAPDAAMSYAAGLAGGVKGPGNFEATNIDASASATAALLSGRDNLVLLAREALFRICEGNANGAIPDTQVPRLVSEVLTQITTIALRDASQTQAIVEAKPDRSETAPSFAIDSLIQQLQQQMSEQRSRQ